MVLVVQATTEASLKRAAERATKPPGGRKGGKPVKEEPPQFGLFETQCLTIINVRRSYTGVLGVKNIYIFLQDMSSHPTAAPSSSPTSLTWCLHRRRSRTCAIG